MNEFKRFHPFVNFIYFVFVIGFSSAFLNPLCLFLSLLGSLCYFYIISKEKKQFRYFLLIFIFAALFNPLFNHRGITVLTYLPSGNPLTLESILYGLASGIMLVNVIAWFSCFNKVMTSDKFIYLFGKIMPSLSLILSMTLRFVPKFMRELKNVSTAQKGIGKGISEGKGLDKIKSALSVLSITVTWAFENAIETSDSMKSRGYGLKDRSAFSVFNFDKRDKISLALVLFTGFYVFAGAVSGVMKYNYFPSMGGTETSFYGLSVFFAYAFLTAFPLIIEFSEVIRWNALKSKM